MRKTHFITMIIAVIASVATVVLWEKTIGTDKPVRIEHISSPGMGIPTALNERGEVVPLDFSSVAEKVVDAVVHIKATREATAGQMFRRFDNRQLPDPFRDFFGERFYQDFMDPGKTPQRDAPMQVGSGSGVVINSQGYIITNNHVIADAHDIEVTLHDNRNFKATVVGTDPTTDLALIQIKANNLPTLPMVNSDDVRVGEWVLAVGNPFSLNSTVTAGIVSAKGRNINILREKFAVESFIQTDAAINPGNSGGALVNLQGGLVGINTAIASPTGAYSGYGFAVPSNIVNKVVEDLLKYGVVQRAVLGVMIRSVDGALMKDKDLSVNSGTYIDSLLENSAAAAAGLQVGDVIVEVNDIPIRTSPELQETIARYRPGDKITLTALREGKEKTFEVVLNNANGGTELANREYKDLLSVLGVDAQEVEPEKAKELGVHGGVEVSAIYAGKIRQQTRMREGFIITKVNNQRIKTMDDLGGALKKADGGVMLEGVYPDLPGTHYYAFGLQS